MNRRKGFTLIELLSVVVILAIISLIAIPIILNVTEDARIAAEKRSIEGIVKSAKLYYSESLLSVDIPEKKEFYYGVNQTDKLDVDGRIPDDGTLTIASDGQIALSLAYGNRCYIKDYDETEIILSDSDICFTVSEPTLYEKPTISFELLSEINEYDWIKDKLEIKVNTQSNSMFQVESFTYCVNNEGNVCTPDKTIEKTNDVLIIETSGNNIICGYATDRANNGEIVCSDIYKLDNINPTLGEINISGSSVNGEWFLSPVEITYIDGTDALSGHEYTKADILINGEIQEEEITYYDEDTQGIDLLVTTSDKAGNILKNTKVLKIDQEFPEILGLDKLIVGIDEDVDFFEDLEYVDEISGVDKVTVSVNSVSELGLGEHVITYTITDKAGNQAQYQRNVLVLNEAPAITFRATGVNSRGWAKKDINLRMTGKKNSDGSKVESYTWCYTPNGECTPTTIVAATKTTSRYVRVKLTEEGKNNVCVYLTYEDKSISETICTNNSYGITYNIDKTIPIPGEITIVSGTMGNEGWYISPVTSTYTEGTDLLSGHYKTTITGKNKTSSSKATKITVTTTDKAGNVAKNIKTIKIDRTKPSLTNLSRIKMEQGENYPLLEKVRSYDYMSGVKSVTTEPLTTENLPIGENIIKYTITDVAGNIKEYTRKVIVVEVKPPIEYTSSVTMNSYGYTNKNFFVTMKANSTLYKKASKIVWCSTMTQTSCIPKKEVELTNNEVSIVQDGTTIICANVIYEDNSQSAVVCSPEYKKDTVNPISGTIEVSGTLGNDSWYVSDVAINVIEGTDALSGHLSTISTPASITTDTKATTITLTTKDKAGNSVSEDIVTVKRDVTKPEIATSTKIETTTITLKDVTSGLSKYCINQSEDITNCTWENLNNINEKTITHKASVAGTYYVHVYDVAGHINTQLFTATLDTTGPSIEMTNTEATTKIEITDDLSGINKYCINQNNDVAKCTSWTSAKGVLSYTTTHTATATGTYYVHVYDVSNNLTTESFSVSTLTSCKDYNIADQVTLVDGTKWYVIAESKCPSTTVTLFASNNISSSGWTTTGYMAFDAKNHRTKATSTYCTSSTGCNAYSAVSGTYTNGTKSGTVIVDSSIKIFLDGTAQTKINNSLISSGGTPIQSIRLITTNEICNIINYLSNSNVCAPPTARTLNIKTLSSSTPTWIYSIPYWTMTPYSSNASLVYQINTGGTIGSNFSAYNDEKYGARPVIVIDKSNIR